MRASWNWDPRVGGRAEDRCAGGAVRQSTRVQQSNDEAPKGSGEQGRHLQPDLQTGSRQQIA